jgi:hypothetical protein
MWFTGYIYCETLQKIKQTRGENMKADELKLKIDALAVGERLILSGVDENIYHASEGIGSTLLKAADRSMAHFKFRRDNARTFSAAQLKTFAIGSATHCLVLEPELYQDKFIAQPDTVKTRSGAKWLQFASENKDKTILTVGDELLASSMAESLFDEAGDFFIGGDSEKSYWYRHKSGLVLKARVDYQKDDAIIDIKTSIADGADKFSNRVKYDYDLQDSLYLLVTGLKDMLYIGVHKEAPHPVYLCKQGADVRERATARMNELFDDLNMARATNTYPNIAPKLVETSLSSWELNNL